MRHERQHGRRDENLLEAALGQSQPTLVRLFIAEQSWERKVEAIWFFECELNLPHPVCMGVCKCGWHWNVTDR